MGIQVPPAELKKAVYLNRLLYLKENRLSVECIVSEDIFGSLLDLTAPPPNEFVNAAFLRISAGVSFKSVLSS